MEFEEAKSQQEKALAVLQKYNVKDSLMWIMEHSIVTEAVKEHYDLDNISKAQSFKFLKNTYEMFFFNLRTTYWDNGSATMGDFRLYFNKEIVLETRFHSDDGWWELDLSIDYEYFIGDRKFDHIGGIKKVKLGDWVKDLPKVVELKKTELDKINKDREIEDKENAKKRLIERTKKDFDLGDFEDE